MKILVTGGAGFIGSHTVVELQARGHNVVIVDNFSNSSRHVLTQIEAITGIKPECEEFDLVDREKTIDFFHRHRDIGGVIHFAAFKSVNESVEFPLRYYRNNLQSLMNILEAMDSCKVPFLVFSSSCTVYGQPGKLPVAEDAPVQPANSPYGNTKQIAEEIISDFSCVSPLKVISLRYFNPIGAHDSALIGELPNGIPNNLMPFITQTAIGIRQQLKVFGHDYRTPDGTCIRDFIHVVDLAKAHLAAIERLESGKNQNGCEVFNLGTGIGYSVLDVIKSFEKVTGEKLDYVMTDRRPGDIEQIWANTELANKVLGWKAERGLDEMTLSAWNWELALNKKLNN